MDFNPRLLSVKLKQVGSNRGVEILRRSSGKTLNTIFEDSFSSIEDFSSLEETKGESDDDSCRRIRHRNDDNESFPSLEWTQTVDQIVFPGSKEKKKFPSAIIQKAFDQSYGRETKNEAFERLVLLEEKLGDAHIDNKSLCIKKRLILRARESQLRRRIFKLQKEDGLSNSEGGISTVQ